MDKHKELLSRLLCQEHMLRGLKLFLGILRQPIHQVNAEVLACDAALWNSGTCRFRFQAVLVVLRIKQDWTQAKQVPYSLDYLPGFSLKSHFIEVVLLNSTMKVCVMHHCKISILKYIYRTWEVMGIYYNNQCLLCIKIQL